MLLLLPSAASLLCATIYLLEVFDRNWIPKWARGGLSWSDWRVHRLGKGWFIYTPITIFMVLDYSFWKKEYKDRWSPTLFSISDHYCLAWLAIRGTYSCGPLQIFGCYEPSYGGINWKAYHVKYRIIAMALSVFLTCVNLFQIWQYNKTIIHYDDRTRYYAAVYLNPSPSPIDMSLLDTDECIDTAKYNLASNSAPWVLLSWRNGSISFTQWQFHQL